MRSRAALMFGAIVAATACEQVTAFQAEQDAAVPSGWTVISAGTTNLNAVSGLSDTAVWAVGDQGRIVHWNGKQLLTEASGTKVNLRGVFALDATHVYAVGDQGTILLRGASTWQPVGAGVTSQVLTGVWADAQQVVAVGSYGTVVVGTTAGYQLVANTGNENLLSVSGTPGVNATAVGALGLVITVTGTTLARAVIPAFSKLLSGVVVGSGAAYYVGQQGTVFLTNGGGFVPVTGCPESALRSVSIAGNDAWTVGWDGTICEITAAGVGVSRPYTDLRWFNGIYAASPTSLWIVGASGTLLHGLPPAALPDAGAKDGAP